jgi:hypothetical protein
VLNQRHALTLQVIRGLSGADLSTSHGSHVGSLKTFGSGPLMRNCGSENDLAAASMPIAAAAFNIQSYRARRASAADIIGKLVSLHKMQGNAG